MEGGSISEVNNTTKHTLFINFQSFTVLFYDMSLPLSTVLIPNEVYFNLISIMAGSDN
jgi:hypothetical protein